MCADLRFEEEDSCHGRRTATGTGMASAAVGTTATASTESVASSRDHQRCECLKNLRAAVAAHAEAAEVDGGRVGSGLRMDALLRDKVMLNRAENWR